MRLPFVIDRIQPSDYLNLLHFVAVERLGGTIRKFALLALITAIQFGAAADLGAQDPRVGSWTLVSAQSAWILPTDSPSRLCRMKCTSSCRAKPTSISRRNRTDTKRPRPAISAFNQIELHRIDKKQAEVKEKKDGALVATVREKLSTDGNELTTTTASSRPCRPDHGVDADRRHEGRR